MYCTVPKKKRKEKEGDVAQVRGTKNKIKPLTKRILMILFKKKQNKTKLIKKKKK